MRFMISESVDECFEFGVYALDRQPHDVVERAVDALDRGIADPLLDAVAAGLVVGAAMIQIVGYFFVGKVSEPHVGADRERVSARRAAECDARDHGMPLPRQVAQHGERLVAVAGLA